MTRTRLSVHRACLPSALAVVALLFCPLGPAAAQQGSSGGFLDNLFNRGQSQPAQQQTQAQPQQPAINQPGGGDDDINSRIDRIEGALRQLTGTVEDLQHQNQMLQMQLKRMQDDTDYRFQHMNAGGAMPPTQAQPPAATPGPAPAPGQRSDAFNPAQHPGAPGVPHALGNPGEAVTSPPAMGNQVQAAPAAPGAPLDLSTAAAPQPPASVPNGTPMARAPQAAPMTPPQGGMPMTAPPGGTPMTAPHPGGTPMAAPRGGQLPPPPPRNPSATGVQLATLPPSSSPKDEYDLAYGYVLHKNYGLAEQAFRDFLRKYPNEKLLPDAQYWLGESQFEQKRYHDAAESFLAVSTKYEHSGKAPQALLRLGQSLAAMHQKEAACATFAEVDHKYPHAAAGVKRNVAREEKRTHC